MSTPTHLYRMSFRAFLESAANPSQRKLVLAKCCYYRMTGMPVNRRSRLGRENRISQLLFLDTVEDDEGLSDRFREPYGADLILANFARQPHLPLERFARMVHPSTLEIARREVYGPEPTPDASRFAADPTVRQLAEAIYKKRTWGHMPILADALEEAGCDDPVVLSHCWDKRARHSRGCWVIDLLTGRS